ncbi:MAG: hypothetical protein RSB74_01655 [Kiritimatiellia bacterium]
MLYTIGMSFRPWMYAVGMTALFGAAIMYCFASVLGLDVVFVAPDAPIVPMTRMEGWKCLISAPFSLLPLLTGLFGYKVAYEGTFWVDAYVMCWAVVWMLRGRGVTWGAAWVGGFCAGLMGYFFTLFCAGHRGVVETLVFAVLTLAALQSAMISFRWWMFSLVGVFLALGLAPQPDIWFLFLFPLVAFGIWLMVVERRWRTFRALICRGLLTVVVFAVVAVGTGAWTQAVGPAKAKREADFAQVTAQIVDEGEAREARRTFVTDWSLPPEDCLEFLIPGVWGYSSYQMDVKPYRGQMGMAGNAFRQHTVHMGVLGLFLALLAWRRRHLPEARDLFFWYAVAVVAVVAALGRFTPLYQLLLSVPILGEIRAPVKWLHVAGLAVAICAGIGAGQWVSCKRWWVAFVLAALVALNMTWVARHYVFPRDLSHNALTRAVPSGAKLLNAVRWGELDAICHWQRIALADDPSSADVVVAAVQQGVRPLATLTVRGHALGLYRLNKENGS